MADKHKASILRIISLFGLQNTRFVVTEQRGFVAESGCFAELNDKVFSDRSANLYKESKSDISKTND